MLLDSDTQLNRSSYYEVSADRGPQNPPLQGQMRADVVVVGAGFAGLSAALNLAERGMRVVVLEADRICGGASGRNGGQTIVGYASGQQPFEEQLGPDASRLAWNMSLEAVNMVDQRIAQHSIQCDRVKGYLTVAVSARKAKALAADVEKYERQYGFKNELLLGADTRKFLDSPRYCAAAFESTSGHLHPLKYGLGLAQAAQAAGVQIFEKSAVTNLTEGPTAQVKTEHGSVHASFVVLAGNYALAEYGPCIAPAVNARIMPVGTYMVGTEPLPPALCAQLIPSNAAVCDNDFVLDYFRFSADHRLLFGGRVSYTTQTPKNLKETMRQRLVNVFPALSNTAIDFVWGGFVDISMNRAPDFGRVGQNVYYLQGFSGHGVAATGLAGKLAAEAIAGQAERFDVFAKLKHRSFPGGPWLRMPSLVLGTAFHRLRDLL